MSEERAYRLRTLLPAISMALLTIAAATPAVAPAREGELECTRFPEQCPCTTEWGKGIK